MSGANPVEQVVFAHDQAGGHFGMLALGASMGAIFAVASDVEDWAEFLLQQQRFSHKLFRTGVMVDCWQDWERLFAGKQYGLGMAHVGKRKRPRHFTAAFRRR